MLLFLHQKSWSNLLVIFALSSLLAACGTLNEQESTASTSSSTEQTETAVSTSSVQNTPIVPTAQLPIIDLEAIPDVDKSLHSVPLENVYFDTFQPVNRAVPLSDADNELILRLRDAIPPIYAPKFETAVSADGWLTDDDLVLGYADGDEAYAYPVNILNFHEIVSHDVNGRSIAATYCPLCRSGVVYDRELDGQTLLLGNTSALYESDMVMLDHQTGSYWVQVSGEAIVGELTGSRLTLLPSQTTTWGAWKAQHPNTLSLSRNTGHNRDYNRNPFTGYREGLNATGRFPFPVSDAVRDERLDPGTLMLGVEVENVTRAYSLEVVEADANVTIGVINDVVGETAVVVFIQNGTGAAYSPTIDGQTLTFTYTDGLFNDNQTDSHWNMAGQAIEGKLSGTQLEPFPTRATLWFALIAAYPDLTLYPR